VNDTFNKINDNLSFHNHYTSPTFRILEFIICNIILSVNIKTKDFFYIGTNDLRLHMLWIRNNTKIGASLMPDKRGIEYYQKALRYDALANYYKYVDASKFINCYQKHLHYLTKAQEAARTQPSGTNLPTAMIRFLHASPTTENVDIYINARLVVRDLPFKEVGTYLSLPAGKYHIDIYPSGNQISTVITKKIDVEAGKVYLFAIIGTKNKLQLLPYEQQPGVPTGETKLRFIHLSPDTQPVDIGVSKGDVVFSNVAYKKATSYLGLTPMTINLEAREAGTKNILLPIQNLKVKPNRIYTIVAVGLSQGEPSLQTIVLKG
jgi:hypothetical protein